MKKQYTTPELKVVKVNPSAFICVSASFGDGNTDIMHAKQDNMYFEEEDYLEDE